MMTSDFTSFSRVFYSYQDNGWMIMKGCVQLSPVYGREDFALSRAQTRDRLISRSALNSLRYQGSLTY